MRDAVKIVLKQNIDGLTTRCILQYNCFPCALNRGFFSYLLFGSRDFGNAAVFRSVSKRSEEEPVIKGILVLEKSYHCSQLQK